MNRRTSFSREEDHGKRFYQCFHSKGNEGLSCKKVINPVFYASESDFTEKHKSSLEIYLEKLKSTQYKQVSPEIVSDLSEMDDQSTQLLASKELGLLEEYLNKLQQGNKFMYSFTVSNAHLTTKHVVCDRLLIVTLGNEGLLIR